MKTFEAEWQEYFKACFPNGGCAPNQEKEMRQCFFAGAFSFIWSVLDIKNQPMSQTTKNIEISRMEEEIHAVCRPRRLQ